MAGLFSTLCKAEVKIKLPELNVKAKFFAQFHITSQKSNYNVIFGQDSPWELGTNLDFQSNYVGWKESKIPMKSINCKVRTNFSIQISDVIKSAAKELRKFSYVKWQI